MASLLNRLGQLETRRALNAIWTGGKRRKGDWICFQCREKSASQQRRSYSDAAGRLPNDMGRENQRGNKSYGQSENESDIVRGNHGEPDAGERQPGASWRDELVRWQSKHASSEDPAFFDQRQPVVKGDESEWAQAEELDESGPSDDFKVGEEFEKVVYVPLEPDEMLKLDYKSTLSDAVSSGATDLVIRCLFSAMKAHDMDFIRAIPAQQFSDIIRLLDPQNFVAKLGTLHIELSSFVLRRIGAAPMREVAYEYSTVIRRVVDARRRAGVKPSFDDYKLLLRAARDLGSARKSRIMWNSLLEDGYTPDRECYKQYLGCLISDGRHLVGTRQKFRVVPFNMLARTGLANRTRSREYRLGKGGIKEHAMKFFRLMLWRGVSADQETFSLLMTACAREGDMKTVRAMLRRMWNIDADALDSSGDQGVSQVKQYPLDSPLRPKEDFLITIAHVYGINNDIPTALRLIDFIARNYELKILPATWSMLFEWAFVLSLKRSTKEREKYGLGEGKLASDTPERLWTTMTSAPYNVTPTMCMYNHYISSLARRYHLRKVVEIMHEALPLAQRSRREADQAEAFTHQQVANRALGKVNDAAVEAARQTWDSRLLIQHRDTFFIMRWFRCLLFAMNNRHRDDGLAESFRDIFPRLLWDLRAYAPRQVFYETPTGLVDLLRVDPHAVRAGKTAYERVRGRRRRLRALTRRYIGDTWVLGHRYAPEKPGPMRRPRSAKRRVRDPFHRPIAVLSKEAWTRKFDARGHRAAVPIP
jgi:hypothetical protein